MITRRERLDGADSQRPLPREGWDLVPRRVAERERSREQARPAPVPSRPNLPAETNVAAKPAAPADRPLTVSEALARVRDVLQGEFRYPIRIEGEVSNVRQARGGNLYFTLKDKRAQLRVVVFSRDVPLLACTVENGTKVVARGWIGAYLEAGDLQLRAEAVEALGAGERAARTEALKRKLAAEGVFDLARKRPLPFFPRTIGLVTSPTGAAIRDVLSTIDRRCPKVRVVLSPVRVSGEAAAPALALALSTLDRLVACDVIIVARGGGSREELLAFDEEPVVRAIVACRAPVVTGIGHETDVSLADLAADVRAPTPTAAAELAVPELVLLEASLKESEGRLAGALRARVVLARERLESCARSFGFRATRERVREGGRKLEDLDRRLERAARASLERSGAAVAAAAGRLDSLSPHKGLARGFSLTTRRETGRVVRDASDVSAGDELETRLAHGTVRSRVVSVETEDGRGHPGRGA